MILKRNTFIKGFTLVELLVVMTILALLVAVLLPALSRARQQGQSITCMNNLRQMTVAAINYTFTNNNYYPIAYYNPKKAGQIRYNYNWDFTTCKNSASTPAKVTVEPGILWQKVTIEKIQQCPSFKGASNTAMNEPYTGYNYNISYIGFDETQSPANSIRVTHVKKPYKTAIFGDGQCIDGGANKFMRAPFSNPQDASFTGRHAGAQGYRHLGKTGVSYCDGHSKSVKERFTNMDDEYGRKELEKYNETNTVKIGFLSPDNSVYNLE